MLNSKWDRYKLPPRPNDQAGEQGRRGQADMLRLLGGGAAALAPVAGGAIGGLVGGLATGGAGVLPGMTAGAGLGAAAGQGINALTGYAADSTVEPDLEADLDRQAKLQALFMLGGRR